MRREVAHLLTGDAGLEIPEEQDGRNRERRECRGEEVALANGRGNFLTRHRGDAPAHRPPQPAQLHHAPFERAAGREPLSRDRVEVEAVSEPEVPEQ